MLLTIIAFILVLSVLVFVHELGHFWTAKKFGIIPKEFGFGFPPRLGGVYRDEDGKWKWVWGAKEINDAKGTVYSINWIPIGGFVNIGEDEEESGDPNHFINKPIWQRAIILSAGVSMNIILAAVLISIGLMIGLPQVLEDISPQAKVLNKHIQVIQVQSGSPAEKAGVKMGDVISKIDGREYVSYDGVQKYVDNNIGKELIYVFGRGEDMVEKTIIPELREDTGMGGIGVAIAETGMVKYPIHIAVWEGVKTTVYLTWAIIVAFFDLFKGLVAGQGIGADVAGPIGIAALTGQVARLGLVYILQFSALLSINLAIINFLPFPALDGGRVLFLAIEKIKGAPVKRELETTIHYIGFSLLMLLVVVVTFRDVMKYGDKFKDLWGSIMGLF